MPKNKQKAKVKILPPPEIFDVLHAAEIAGVVLPTVVDEWWAVETWGPEWRDNVSHSMERGNNNGKPSSV